ncbi:hypothetical protein [Pseudomonas boanensis]|uniref:hypothetical protein n=1 Tax=Metapseudomonas boanensis TaxID=2822138 RepID=UPI0035D47709
MDENPYAAPQVELVENAGPRQMLGWSPEQFRLLGWLSLVSVVGTLVLTGLAAASGAMQSDAMPTSADWLSAALTLLGCYLLIQLKRFAEARFSAVGLGWPVWAVVVASLLVELLDFVLGDASLEPGWSMLLYFGVLALSGALTTWMAVCLLKVQNAYPVFRVMAWLDLAGGILLATVILMLLALFPLIAASAAMMLVFFKAAGELEGRKV